MEKQCEHSWIRGGIPILKDECSIALILNVDKLIVWFNQLYVFLL